MLLPLVALVAALSLPHGARLDGQWSLGNGYSARVYQQHRVAGSTDAHRSFELLRGKSVSRRWREFGQAMPVHVRDVTGDGIQDALVVDFIGGSGACENYRLYGGPRLRIIWRLRNVCEGHDTRVAPPARHRRLDRHRQLALHKLHPLLLAPLTHREWRWNGSRLRLVRRTVTTHPPTWIDPGMPG